MGRAARGWRGRLLALGALWLALQPLGAVSGQTDYVDRAADAKGGRASLEADDFGQPRRKVYLLVDRFVLDGSDLAEHGGSSGAEINGLINAIRVLTEDQDWPTVLDKAEYRCETTAAGRSKFWLRFRFGERIHQFLCETVYPSSMGVSSPLTVQQRDK